MRVFIVKIIFKFESGYSKLVVVRGISDCFESLMGSLADCDH